jgi:hypothetical protein
MNDCAVQQIVLYINDYCSVALRSRPFHPPETKGKQILMSLRPMKHIGLGSASSKSMILADQKYDSQDPRQCANTMRQYNAGSLLSRSHLFGNLGAPRLSGGTNLGRNQGLPKEHPPCISLLLTPEQPPPETFRALGLQLIAQALHLPLGVLALLALLLPILA